MPESLGLQIFRWAGAALLTAAVVACQSTPLESTPDDVGAPAASGAGSGDEGGDGPVSDGGSPTAGAGGAAGSDALGEPERLPVLARVHSSSREDASIFNARSATSTSAASPSRARRCASRWSRRASRSPAGPTSVCRPSKIGPRRATLSIARCRPRSTKQIRLLRLRPASSCCAPSRPFGGPLEVDEDITDLVNGLPGAHQLGLRIDTWSDADGIVSGSNGEWIASAEVRLWRGTAPRRVLAVLPLVLGDQVEVDAAPLTFEVPEGAGSARIDYRVTGHGGTFSGYPALGAGRRILPTHARAALGRRALARAHAVARVQRQLHAHQQRLRLWPDAILRAKPVRRSEQRSRTARQLVPRQPHTADSRSKRPSYKSRASTS